MDHPGLKILFLFSLLTLCQSKKALDIPGKDNKIADSNTSNPTDLMESGRTMDFLSSLGNFMLNLTLDGMNFSFPPSGNSTCPNNANLLESLKIPLYIIFPAIIIGVVILIKKIGLFTAWIPSVKAPWFQSLKNSWNADGDSDSGGWGSSSGYPSPSPAYGSPPAPSPAYGPGGWPSTNSRQTAILESIDNLNNLYGQPGQPSQPAQPPLPATNNNAGDFPSDDAQNYMSYYYNQPQPAQVQPQQPSNLKAYKVK